MNNEHHAEAMSLLLRLAIVLNSSGIAAAWAERP